MITNDAREAWAKARDNGLRSQHEVIVERLNTGCEVQIGAKGGEGAGKNADYAPVHICIESMSEPVQNIGDYLNCQGSIFTEGTMRKKTIMAGLAVSQIAMTRLPGFKKWSNERQQLFYWLALAAMRRVWVVLNNYQDATDCKGRNEGRTLEEPWMINKWLRGVHGKSIDLKRWGEQWSGPWALLQDVIYELDDQGQVAVEECVGIKRKSMQKKVG